MKIKTYTINLKEANEDMWLTQREVENIINTIFCKRVLLDDDSADDWVEITNQEKELLEKQIKELTQPEDEKGTQDI